jgi:hypothetical protein
MKRLMELCPCAPNLECSKCRPSCNGGRWGACNLVCLLDPCLQTKKTLQTVCVNFFGLGFSLHFKPISTIYIFFLEKHLYH